MPGYLSQFITSLGDIALLGPVALLVAAILGPAYGWRVALAWLGAFCACVGLVAGLKWALCYGWAMPLRSPSGHTAMSAMVYGGLAVVIGQGRGRPTQLIGLMVAQSLAGLIGYTRIIMGLHSLADVLGGLAIGLVCLWGFAWPASRLGGQGRLGLGALLGMLALLAATMLALQGASLGDAPLPACGG